MEVHRQTADALSSPGADGAGATPIERREILEKVSAVILWKLVL